MKRRLPLFHGLSMAILILLVLSGCHSSKKNGSEFYQSQFDQLGVSSFGSHGKKDKKNSSDRSKIVEEAYTWLGTPYGYAHSEKGIATDCSGMVLKVYETVVGISLPRNSALQHQFCRHIKRKDIKIGDLVFFATGSDPDKISHVGIMLDEENFIHASSSKGVVVSSIDTPYYIRTFKGFGRVPD